MTTTYTVAGRYGGQQVINGSGTPLPNTAILVYLTGTDTKVDLFSDRAKADGIDNPVLTDSSGNLEFFCDPGLVDLVDPKGGIVTVAVQPDPASTLTTDSDLSTSIGAINEWSADTSYLARSLVTQNGSLYQAIDDVAPASSFDPTDWTHLADSDTADVSVSSSTENMLTTFSVRGVSYGVASSIHAGRHQHDGADPLNFADTVTVADIPGVDPTGLTDSTQALLAALIAYPQTKFDFGGAKNKYLVSSTDLTGCTLTTDDTSNVVVPSTANLAVGQPVQDVTTGANIATGTVITAIVDATHLTVTPAPVNAATATENLVFQFQVTRDGLRLLGHGAELYIAYPQDSHLNGVHFFTNGGSVSAEGIKFINTNPKTAYQRGLGSSNNGDLVRFGSGKGLGVWADAVRVHNCEFWGAYSSGLEILYSNRASLTGNSHCHANGGNGFGFTNIIDTIFVDDISAYNSGDDMLIVINDGFNPAGTQHVTIGDGVVLQHGSAKGVGIDGAQWVSIGSVKVSDTYASGIFINSDSGAVASGHVKIKHPILRAIGFHFGDNGSALGSTTTAWVAGTSYSVGDIRSHHGATWICTTANSATSFGSLLPGQNANWNEYITYIHSTGNTSQHPIDINATCHDVDIDSPDIDKAIGIGINIPGASPSQEVTGASTLGNPLPPIQEITVSGSAWTITFAAAHGLTTGNSFVLTGFNPAGYNGSFTVASAPTTTTVTVTNATTPGPIATFGTGGTAVTTITLTGIPTTMPLTGSGHAVIYDPNANVATVFTYTSITTNTLNGCFANSPSAAKSFAVSPLASYVNVPVYGLRVRNPKIKGTMGPAIQIADGAATAGGQVDYLQAYDVVVTGIDLKEVGGGLIVGTCSEVLIDDWKVRSYLWSGGGTRHAITYTSVRNLALGTGTIDNDDGASTAISATGTNLNVSTLFVGSYQQFLTSGSASLPAGTYLIVATGGGGQGGGAGSAAAAQLQAGGSAGAAGTASAQIVTLSTTTTVTVTIGAGGTTGGAGGALGGNAGSAGQAGADSTVTGTGVSVTGKGGRFGNASSASSTTVVGGGMYGVNGTALVNQNASGPGGGGQSAAAGGQPSHYAVGGGGGGGPATATTGGSAGTAGTAVNGGGNGSSGASGTSAGGDGAAATVPGAGGPGGGGGAAGTGKGGAGGAGANGQVQIWRIA